jgi:hypothetical protein
LTYAPLAWPGFPTALALKKYLFPDEELDTKRKAEEPIAKYGREALVIIN